MGETGEGLGEVFCKASREMMLGEVETRVKVDLFPPPSLLFGETARTLNPLPFEIESRGERGEEIGTFFCEVGGE